MNEDNILKIDLFLPSEEKCLKILEKIRWPDKIICPVCKSEKIKKNGKEGIIQRYHCHSHTGTFRVTTGTIFEGSVIPLGKWFYFMFHYSRNQSCKKLKETLDISEPTAYRLAKLTSLAIEEGCECIKLTDSSVFDEMYLCTDKNCKRLTEF